jgi:sugar phosphate isomerase/epimerase
MAQTSHAFPLSVQLTLSEEDGGKAALAEQLQAMRSHRITGVELNIVHPEKTDTDDLRRFLDSHGMKLTYLATGGAANARGLSLSHEVPEEREESVRACLAFIDFARKMEAGIIVGFFQGGLSSDPSEARSRFRQSLDQIAPYAVDRGVSVLIEPLNRYLTSVTNSLEDAAGLIEDYDRSTMRLLPDTFHMNIEETNTIEALQRFAPFYESVHLSDNNRFYPGLGAIDFMPIVGFLKESGFQGGLGFEGNIRTSFEDDLNRAMAYLAPALA